MYDRKKLDELQDKKDQWDETTLQKTLARFPERQPQFITTSSEPINRLYTPLDTPDLDYFDDLGLPGEYPFTARHPPHHAPRQGLDHADVRRFWHRRRDQCPLQIPA